MRTSQYIRKIFTLLPLFIILLSFSVDVNAQITGIDSTFQKQFNIFNNSIKVDFNSFRQQNDSLFLQFLTQSWKEFDAVQNKIPSFPKPIHPPIYKAPEVPVTPKANSILHESHSQSKVTPLIESKTPDMLEQTNLKQQELTIEEQTLPSKTDTIPEKAILSNAETSTKIEYFGTVISMPAIVNPLPVLSALSKQSIVEYFAEASGSSLLNMTASTLKKESAEYSLNDWGLTTLLMKAAQKMYTDYNDQVMFTWFALLRSGFNVKVGYNKQNVFLLLPSNEILYEISYIVNERAYYLLNFGNIPVKPDRLSIHEADYPQSNAGLSFLITQIPGLTAQFTRRTLTYTMSLELNLNKNLIAFYDNYPQCELKVFFKAPLSADAIAQLDTYFIPTLERKNDDERVAFLLDFVQKAIGYQTDGQQFGHEKYLFADETLYYTAADCEDRAIFLAKLIDRYTHCKTICLIYPAHVSLAVNLTSVPNGKFITYKNLKYYHCDPTYIGAGCGIPMADLENVTPQIIDFNL